MTIPGNLREPAVIADVSNKNANQTPARMPLRALLIGQKTSAGTATANTFVRVTSADQVGTLAGVRSLLHQEAIAWFAANQGENEVWIGVLADPGGTSATGLISVAATPPAGVLNLYVAGLKFQITINTGDTNAEVAAAITAALAASPASAGLPITAAEGTSGAVNTVILTAIGTGLFGNSIDVRFDYSPDDASPVIPTVTAMASGAGQPSLTTLIANLGDQHFEIIVNPYTDATSLTAIEAELVRRAQPVPAIPGQMFYGIQDSYANTTAKGLTRNSQYGSLVPGQSSPTSPWQFAAAVAGIAASEFQADPGLGLQTVAIPFVLAPEPADQWTFDERNLALFDGVSSWKVDAGGQPIMSRLITTYRLNSAGSVDESYLDATTMFTLMYFRFSLVALLSSEFARSKFAANGQAVGPQQNIATPNIIAGVCLNWFDDMALLGLAQNKQEFKNGLVVAQDLVSVSRANVTLTPQMIENLLDIANTIAFLR